MTDEPINPVAEEIEALDRIAHTRDGLLLHRYLRRVLEAVYEFETDGALRAQTGRRTLARDLMAHMAAGIEGEHGRPDEPLLTRPGSTAGTRAYRGTARRVSPDPSLAFAPDSGPDAA